MLRVIARPSANTGRRLRHPSNIVPPTLARRALATIETPTTLSQRALTVVVHVDTPARKTAIGPTPQGKSPAKWHDWWRGGTEQGQEVRNSANISPRELWECIRKNKPALLFKTQLFDLNFKDFHAGKLEGFEAYAIVLCHAARTFKEKDPSMFERYGMINFHLVNVLNHLRAATIGMPSLAQPIQMHMTQQASVILNLLRNDETAEAHIYVSHLHNELNAIVNKQPAPFTYANAQELGRSRCENLYSVENSEFKLFKKELDALNDNFSGLTDCYLRATLRDIVMYLPRVVSALLSAEKLTGKQASAIDCKITDLAKSLASLPANTAGSNEFSDQGLAALANVYHLHQKWLGAMKLWIKSQ